MPTLRQVSVNADIGEHAAAQLLLELGIVADLLDRGGEPVFMRHLREENILAVGRGYPAALHVLSASDGCGGTRKCSECSEPCHAGGKSQLSRHAMTPPRPFPIRGKV